MTFLLWTNVTLLLWCYKIIKKLDKLVKEGIISRYYDPMDGSLEWVVERDENPPHIRISKVYLRESTNTYKKVKEKVANAKPGDSIKQD